MKNLILIISLLFLLATQGFALETFEGDSDGNGAIDMQYGGTNAQTAAGIRANINVEDGAEANEPLVPQEAAESGISTTEYSWSPLRIAQAIASLADPVMSWLGLSDTPSSYTGQAGKYVKVNAGEDALEFDTPSGSGDVTGPASATAGNFPALDATGKILSDSGYAPGDFEPADATIIKEADIGGSIQGALLEGVFVDGDKNKLDGIAAGAEVNVQSDWDAVAGDALILNKPTIPTVSDTAYDATSWNDNLDAASKNAIRDKIEALPGGHDAVTIGTANGLSLDSQQLSLAAATNATPGAATAAHISAIEANTADSHASGSDNQQGDGVTITGAGTAGDPFVAVGDGYEANTDAQDLTLSGNTLAISNDPNTDVDLSGYLDDQTVSNTGDSDIQITGTYPNFTFTFINGSGFLSSISEDTTPTLGGELDANGQDIINLSNVTFQNGAAGGTLRTGTTPADKFQLMAYDSGLASYTDMIELDAGNPPLMHLYHVSDIFINSTGTINTQEADGSTFLLNAYDVDGAAYKTFATMTSGNTPTFNLDPDVTIGGSAIVDTTDSRLHASGSDAETAATIEDIMSGADAVTTIGDTDIFSMVVSGVLKNITGAYMKSILGGGGTQYGYIALPTPHSGGSGLASTPDTDFTNATRGQVQFDNAVADTTNYVEYRLPVPPDMDTSADITLESFFVVAADNGTTGNTQRYYISMDVIASDAAYTGSVELPIAIDLTETASTASGDALGTTTATTLTGWKTALVGSGGAIWVIRVSRDGDDTTNDSSVIETFSGAIMLKYTKD